MSRQDEAEADLKYSMEEYEDEFISDLAEAIENGQVIGIRQVSKRKLRAFFDQVAPMEWFAMSQADPQGALAMIDEYTESVGGAA